MNSFKDELAPLNRNDNNNNRISSVDTKTTTRGSSNRDNDKSKKTTSFTVFPTAIVYGLLLLLFVTVIYKFDYRALFGASDLNNSDVVVDTDLIHGRFDETDKFSFSSLINTKYGNIGNTRLEKKSRCPLPICSQPGSVGKPLPANIRLVGAVNDFYNGAKQYGNKIICWDTSKVVDMSYAFQRRSNFNQPIGCWDTSNAENMFGMFDGATSFNGDINNWNTERVNNMIVMFNEATNFNGDINKWNTERVVLMNQMFTDATSFNRDINDWNTERVGNMPGMFEDATSFNQNLCSWNFENVNSVTDMFIGSGCSFKKKDPRDGLFACQKC